MALGLSRYMFRKTNVMTLHHFNTLSGDRQRKALLHKGVFVAHRETKEFSILLFQLDIFYVEIFFLRESDEIVWIKSFTCTDELSPYLNQIDLSHLLN